jgi:hypothetical protein
MKHSRDENSLPREALGKDLKLIPTGLQVWGGFS